MADPKLNPKRHRKLAWGLYDDDGQLVGETWKSRRDAYHVRKTHYASRSLRVVRVSVSVTPQ